VFLKIGVCTVSHPSLIFRLCAGVRTTPRSATLPPRLPKPRCTPCHAAQKYFPRLPCCETLKFNFNTAATGSEPRGAGEDQRDLRRLEAHDPGREGPEEPVLLQDIDGGRAVAAHRGDRGEGPRGVAEEGEKGEAGGGTGARTRRGGTDEQQHLPHQGLFVYFLLKHLLRSPAVLTNEKTTVVAGQTTQRFVCVCTREREREGERETERVTRKLLSSGNN